MEIVGPSLGEIKATRIGETKGRPYNSALNSYSCGGHNPLRGGLNLKDRLYLTPPFAAAFIYSGEALFSRFDCVLLREPRILT